jgi:2-C-methyl-D-erythritol 4-phosphate cytidylyltransferase/2-C-methyl-D-erythritol 2,4-cyclodiphosphate synthase
VVSILADAGYQPASCDLVVIADRPQIGDRRDEMCSSLSRALGVGTDAVSVKATRPEGLSLSGEGIACMALATIRRRG